MNPWGWVVGIFALVVLCGALAIGAVYAVPKAQALVATWQSSQSTGNGTSVKTEDPKSGNSSTQSIAPAPVSGCSKSGTIAWQNDNQVSGAVYGEAPIGGLSEPCWVVGQTWTSQGGTERWVFAVRPNSVAWLSGHRGGTGWYFGGSDQDVQANLKQQADELVARDGQMKTTIVILPDQANQFRLVTRTKSASTQPAPQVQSQPAQPSQPKPSAPAPSQPSSKAGVCNASDAVGPAILEYGDQSGKATVLKLNQGSTSSRFQGGCFPFDSQSSLDARWTAHKAEFLAKNANGVALEK